MKKTKLKPARSPENTTVTFSCSKKLLAAVDAAAADERRTRTNFITYTLEKAIMTHRVLNDRICPASGCGEKSGKVS